MGPEPSCASGGLATQWLRELGKLSPLSLSFPICYMREMEDLPQNYACYTHGVSPHHGLSPHCHTLCVQER